MIQTVMLKKQSTNFIKARTANSTATALTAKQVTATEPSGAGIHDLRRSAPGAGVHNSLLILPYCRGANNDTFNVRVTGWRRVGTNDATAVWIPMTLAELACTAGNLPGVAGKELIATDFLADTISLTKGSTTDAIVNSPADDTPAYARIDLQGCVKVEIDFDLGITPTEMNALLAFL